MGRKSGITEQQLRDLPHFEESAAFNACERLVLRLAVALTATPANVDDVLFDELQQEFSEPQLAGRLLRPSRTALTWFRRNDLPHIMDPF